MATTSKETRPEEATTGKHGKSYHDFQQNHETGDCQTNCQIYCWDAEDQEMDHVEGSTRSKMEKEMAGGAGAGIVEAQAPNDRKRKRGLYWVPLGTSAHKKGVVAVVG
jgi:hypothetical protein